MRRRRGRAGIVCPVTNAWGGCLPGGRYPCESRRRKGVLTGVAFTQRGVVLGRINCGGKSKRRLEFGINEQHKTCLDLDYCKVRQGGAKKKDTRTRSQKDKDEAYERMKKLFVSKEDMEEFEKNNPQMKDEDSVDPLEETLDSPSPKKRKEKNDDETKAATKSDFTAESADESLFASVKRKFDEYLRRYYKVGRNRLSQKLPRQSDAAKKTTSENIEKGEL